MQKRTTLWFSLCLLPLAAPAQTFLTVYSRTANSVSINGTIWIAADGSADQNDVWVRDRETGEERMVFRNFDHVIGYDWTPDGAQIVFDHNCYISRVNADGPRRQPHRPSRDGHQPAGRRNDFVIRINAGGSVGIGTTALTARLDVAGTAKVRALEIVGGAGSSRGW